ncbi:hypothetical protein QFC21_005881 [Naganishia friedmannii]|uniref:Uncharacterized protein n=1 Tax=Naganishia friedmannii TaxID=89922 RepID=A0ACC2V6I1_9TREE|nr:hypothetical protein QFC21_005881 [Naganishia friedmannii]
MNVNIRPASSPDDCQAIGETYFQAYYGLSWFQHVNAEVNPEDIKNLMSTIASVLLEQSNGLVLVAEQDGQIVGHLMAWERANVHAWELENGSKNPYYNPRVTTNLRGRTFSRWVDQQAGIRKFAEQVEGQHGRFMFIDTIAVLPEFQHQGIGRKLFRHATEKARSSSLSVALASPQESLQACEKLRLAPMSNPIVSRDDDRFQLVPTMLMA